MAQDGQMDTSLANILDRAGSQHPDEVNNNIGAQHGNV